MAVWSLYMGATSFGLTRMAVHAAKCMCAYMYTMYRCKLAGWHSQTASHVYAMVSIHMLISVETYIYMYIRMYTHSLLYVYTDSYV